MKNKMKVRHRHPRNGRKRLGIGLQQAKRKRQYTSDEINIVWNSVTVESVKKYRCRDKKFLINKSIWPRKSSNLLVRKRCTSPNRLIAMPLPSMSGFWAKNVSKVLCLLRHNISLVVPRLPKQFRY